MISIVIPVHNKINFTLSCLQDLSALDPLRHEIIIIDNASTDNTEEEIKKLNLSNLIYHKNSENKGFGFASNQGFKLSFGDIILFLNNDIRIKEKETWTQKIIEHMEENALIGPTGGYVDPDNEFQFVYETNDKNKTINYMSGWCLAAFRSTWNKLILEKEIGPFDATGYFLFFEDTDASFRAAKLEIKFKLIDLPLIHFGHITSNSLGYTNKYYTESRKRFIRKWAK